MRMNKKLILGLGFAAGLIILGIFLFKPAAQKTPGPLNLQNLQVKKQPSATSKEYSDPSGFSFSYPDNLSLNKNEAEDNATYADIQLSSKEVSGSISIKITDSKFKSLDEWLENQGITQKPKEVKLGDLAAWEIQLNDRLILGALDQGILFNIEIPLVEKDFWLPVYNNILTDFSFALPEITASGYTDSSDIILEGEEIVE